MRRCVILLSLCLLALGTAAADTFNFTYTGSLYSGSGTLFATNNGNGSYTATSGSGFFDGFLISLIANPNAPNYSNSPSVPFTMMTCSSLRTVRSLIAVACSSVLTGSELPN